VITDLIGKLKKIIKGSFFKNVTILMSGTAIAQGLAFAASPILSRLYDPAAFGLLGIFTAATGIVAVAASAKYEMAILLPKKDEDAANILVLSIGIILSVVIATLLIVLFFRNEVAELLGSSELAPLLWWAPISILATGLYNAFKFWSTRRKQFKRISISHVLQTGSREGTQLGLGYFTNLQGNALIFGHIVGQACSVLALIIQSFRKDYGIIKESVNFKSIRSLATKHKDFPKYNAPQNVLNSVSQNVPAILLAYYFNPAIVGLYWFTHRILVAPGRLVGSSVRQVFYQRANELINSGKSALNLYLKTTGGLAITGLPILLMIPFGPEIFDFVFGNEWREAGIYAQWLCLWTFVGFINTPTVMMIPILNMQKFQFIYEIVVTGLRVVVIVIGGILADSLIAIALFSLVGVLVNTFLISFIYKKMKRT
jgi:lipopolysaccharide exporter